MYTPALKKAVRDGEWGMGFRIRQGVFAFRNADRRGLDIGGYYSYWYIRGNADLDSLSHGELTVCPAMMHHVQSWNSSQAKNQSLNDLSSMGKEFPQLKPYERVEPIPA